VPSSLDSINSCESGFCLRPGNVGKEHRTEEWLDYFDVVITGCGKPAFFEVKKPLFEVDTKTGALYNTDNGTPMIPIGERSRHFGRAVWRLDLFNGAIKRDHCAACKTSREQW